MILGTTYPNLTQNGRCLDPNARIRPTGILSVESWHETLSKSHRGRIQTISMGWIQKYTTWTRKAWTHIQKRSQPGPWSSIQHTPNPRLIHGREECVGATEGREAAKGRLPGPKEASRSKKMPVEQTARSTDLLMRSEPSTRSRWPGGATPRPAGRPMGGRPAPFVSL